MRILFAMVLGMMVFRSAWAADATCRVNVSSAEGAMFSVAAIAGKGKVFLRSDQAPCPTEAAACRKNGYVLPGDRVVMTHDGPAPYVCVVYPNRSGGSAGFVKRDEVSFGDGVSSAVLSNWVGTWRRGDNTIVVKAAVGGGVSLEGDAYWPSASPPEKQFPGGPNIGNFSAKAVTLATVLHVTDANSEACHVDLAVLGDYAVVRDDGQCGGMNVSFTGVYRRR